MSGLLTPKQVAEWWQVSERQITRLVERGELDAIRVGRCVRLSPVAVAEYEARSTRKR